MTRAALIAAFAGMLIPADMLKLPEPRTPRAPHRADCPGVCCRKKTAPRYLAAVPSTRVPPGEEVRIGGVLVHHPGTPPLAVDECVLEAPSRQTVRMVDRALGVPDERRDAGGGGPRIKKGQRNARRRAQ